MNRQIHRIDIHCPVDSSDFYLMIPLVQQGQYSITTDLPILQPTVFSGQIQLNYSPFIWVNEHIQHDHHTVPSLTFEPMLGQEQLGNIIQPCINQTNTFLPVPHQEPQPQPMYMPSTASGETYDGGNGQVNQPAWTSTENSMAEPNAYYNLPSPMTNLENNITWLQTQEPQSWAGPLELANMQAPLVDLGNDLSRLLSHESQSWDGPLELDNLETPMINLESIITQPQTQEPQSWAGPLELGNLEAPMINLESTITQPQTQESQSWAGPLELDNLEAPMINLESTITQPQTQEPQSWAGPSCFDNMQAPINAEDIATSQSRIQKHVDVSGDTEDSSVNKQNNPAPAAPAIAYNFQPMIAGPSGNANLPEPNLASNEPVSRAIPYVQRQWNCPDCAQVFASKNLVSGHLLAIHKRHPYYCLLCKASFTLRENITKHKKKHSNMKNFPCSKCDSNFGSYRKMQHHYCAKHIEGIFECLVCHEQFSTSKQVNDHQRVHKLAILCPYCYKQYRSDTLQQHILRKHSEA